MKFKIVLSIITCSLCLLVFTISTYAWITITKQNNANNINAGLEEKTCSYSLYSYQEDTWVNSNGTDITVSNFFPGTVEYFKLVITNTMNKDLTIKASLKNYSSSLNGELLYNDTTNSVYVTDRANNDIPMYTANNEDYVMIGTDVLYDCTDGTVQLADYKIEDSVLLYLLENNDTPSLTNSSNIQLNANLITDVTIISTASVTVYFAIEFYETNNDNYYQYQNFNIGGILITLS